MKDKESLPKDKTTVTICRGHYNELLYGLTKELNSVTKQTFNHPCPVEFDGCYSSGLLWISHASFQKFYMPLCYSYFTILCWCREGKRHFLLRFNVLNWMSHTRRNCLSWYSPPFTRQTILKLRPVQSPSGWCAILSLGFWCGSLGCALVCRKGIWTFRGEISSRLWERLIVVPSVLHSPFLLQ